MKKIIKSREPHELLAYRLQPEAVYDGANFTPVKDKIRNQLLAEQGYLCAYCMRRIEKENMKVEHFQCQNIYKDLQLDYSNLLGCCKGNEGESISNQTCDTKKGNRSLSYSPASSSVDIDSKIHYKKSGTIFSCDKVFDKELNAVLNLNSTRLKANRKSALEGIQTILDKNRGKRTKADIDRLLRAWQDPQHGKYKEYYGCIVYYLNKKRRAWQ